MMTSNMLLSLKIILLWLHVCACVCIWVYDWQGTCQGFMYLEPFLQISQYYVKSVQMTLKSDDISVWFFFVIFLNSETAETCVVCIICHVYEAFMMWKKRHLYPSCPLCSFTITGSLLNCFIFYSQIKPWSYILASDNEAKSFSYPMSYFKPRVSKGTYINIMWT